MQGSKVEFLASAEANLQHYGRHGLRALEAAFHGNVQTFVTAKGIWLPTSLIGWTAYNELIDGRQP